MIDVMALASAVAEHADKIEQLHRMIQHQAQRIMDLEAAAGKNHDWYLQPARLMTVQGNWDVT